MTEEIAETQSHQTEGESIATIRAEIPQYPGFAQIENRHASDEILRGRLLEVIEDFQRQVLSVAMYLAGRNKEILRARAAELEQRIEMLADKIRSAPYAFSPFFTFDRVPEEFQEKVMEDDAAVLAAAGEIVRLIEPTLGGDTDFESLLAEVARMMETLDRKIETRLNDIMEFH